MRIDNSTVLCNIQCTNSLFKQYCPVLHVCAVWVPGPEWWEELVARVMRIDNSWDKAAGST